MKSGDSYSPQQAFALLIVGEPKTGKTNLLFSFPSPYILDCDRNLARAVRVSKGKTWFFDDPFVDPKTNSELAENARWNNAVVCLREAAKSPDVKTIVIDGLAAFADMLIAHIMSEVKRTEGKLLDRLRIQDYQPLKTLLTSLILGLRSCGKTLIVTSHQKADKDELTGRIRYTLNMPGSLSENFSGFFSDCWATTSTNAGGKIKYEIHTKPTGFHVSLGTSVELPAVTDVTDKTPDQIWAIIGPKVTNPQPVTKV